MYNILKGLLNVAPRKDIRYYLNSINIIRGDDQLVRLTSTDGSIVISLIIASEIFNVEPNTNVIICANSLTNVLKLFNKKSKPTLKASNDSVTIDGYKLETIDGNYPDVRRVLKFDHKPEATREIGLNLDLLSKLCKGCSTILNSKHGAAKFHIRDASDSILISQTFNECDNLTAAIMPTRL
jgi:DNA polymerase III sliding clamp (beta) subunit (PCNA family)